MRLDAGYLRKQRVLEKHELGSYSRDFALIETVSFEKGVCRGVKVVRVASIGMPCLVADDRDLDADFPALQKETSSRREWLRLNDPRSIARYPAIRSIPSRPLDRGSLEPLAWIA